MTAELAPKRAVPLVGARVAHPEPTTKPPPEG